jgi:WD40 repeat protein/serine/threonine protein kinase/Flp pilus assembly protein TadD
MNTSSDERNPVELLAEEFLDRKRRGEHPTLREYVERYPDLADEIRDLFPALLMMEDLGESSGGTTGSLAADNGAALGVRLERLGDYRILREIGRGGMGVVYEAEQESLGRRVALKVLSAGSLLDPKQVRRFEREAKAAARLHHTNIVPVFGVGRQDGHHYFVMQFIAGLGLDLVLDDLRRLRRANSEVSKAVEPAAAPSRIAGLTGADVARSLFTGRFDADLPPGDGSVTEPFDSEDSAVLPAAVNGPPADSGSSSALLPGSSELSESSHPDRQFYRSVARIGIQVAEALEYANRQGILHRDVKPSNLLLDNHGNVWVADFGLAKTAEADDLTHTGDILGTIRYMAPERFSGHCDARSDVYSLGLTLYELVALRPAYEAADRHTLMDRVLHEEPERLKKLAPGVPRDLETIVAKAIARDPSARYAAAGALAEDLRRYVEDRPIRARRISPAERLMRWCRRNKRLAASIGVAGAALVAAAVLSLLYADRQARHAAEQAEANERIRLQAGELERRSSALASSLSESNRRLATLNFERGQAAFEKGQIGVGMLWTVESLRKATEAGDKLARHVALANLSAWRRHYVEPSEVFYHGGEVLSVAFSPDGKTVLTGSSDKTARLWDAATGRPLGQAMEHSSLVWAVGFSPNGRTVLTGSRDKTARLWDAATGRPLGQPLPHSAPVSSVAFSPDGKTILTGSWDKTARLWDAATGRPLGQPREHRDMVRSVAFSPDGKTILTGCDDNTAQLWDAATGQRLGRPLEHRAPVWAVAFSPDGRSILTGSYDGTARLWNGELGQPAGRLLELGRLVQAMAFSRDGKTILTGGRDGKARLWDVPSGHLLGQPVELETGIYAVALSPDGKTILTGGRDGKARLWDVPSGHLLGQPVELGPEIYAVAWSPDGKTILTGSRDNAARLWDAATGRPLGQPIEHSYQVSSVAFSPDGKRILTGSNDKTARVSDAASGRSLGQPLEHSGALWSVAFSPDGKTILTGSGDKTARLWDAATGRPLGQPMPHSSYVASVTFSPDGKTILTGSSDKTARLWDAASGRPLGQPLEHSGPVWSVAFSPDGRSLLTSDLRTARVWDAPAPLPDDVPRLAAWVEAATGLEMDERGAIRVLDRSAWLERRQRLEQLGGPPPPDPAPRLDPILFGLVPTARGDAWKERGLFDRAEAAYAEAAHARPLNTSVWYALARLHAERGHLDRAAATLAEAVRLMPEDSQLRERIGLALLSAGDRAGWRRSNAALLDRFGGTSNAMTADPVASACVLGPEGTVDPGVPIRLAEAAVRGATETATKANCLTTLGAALYRAGRFNEAIRRLEEGVRLRGGVSQGNEWVFLAMAHHRLGHRDLARRWLERLPEHQPSADPAEFWHELEFRLLRSEAEAVIVYDPVFPADPFAK